MKNENKIIGAVQVYNTKRNQNSIRICSNREIDRFPITSKIDLMKITLNVV